MLYREPIAFFCVHLLCKITNYIAKSREPQLLQYCTLSSCFHFVSDLSRAHFHSDLMSRTWYVFFFVERENVCEKTLLEPVAFQHQNSKGDCLHQCINAAICWSLVVITPHVIGSDTFRILPKRFSQQQLKWDNCIKEIACQQMFLTSWPNTYGNNNMTPVFNFKYWYLFIFDW